ncbi:MAG: HAD family phosphatase [Nitriliruptorales bacterium]|nr:HAD family phosphatase [Nitriliruptorales bacterium]
MDEDPKGLLVDYGGVLTPSVGRSFRDFEDASGLPKGTVFEAVRAAYEHAQGDDPISRVERGELEIDDFNELLAAEFAAQGHEVDPDGLARRMFAGMRPDGLMWQVVRAAHDAGVRTALVSNSWGVDGYPRDRLEEVFDAVLVSGEVGMRKPDPAFFELAIGTIGVPPDRCAFVDDLDRNVEAARELGMFAVHHTDPKETAAALSGFLGLSLEL